MIRSFLVLALLWASPTAAEVSLRLATFNTGLGRDGPGLLLKDILDQDPDILALSEIIRAANPDILLLTGMDNDYQNLALGRFNSLPGLGYPYIFAPLGNAGQDSGLDINGNGRLRDWNDAWGFGRFEGSEGMALLSRFPITGSRTFDTAKWQDFGPAPLQADGTDFFATALWPRLRLAAHSLWDVEIRTSSGPLRILASHPTPPVFDGEEDANGLRNEAEINFLLQYISGAPLTDDSGLTAPRSAAPFVLLADLNADPTGGDSRKERLRALLSHPGLQRPPQLQDQPTAFWETAGNLRVDYVLPSSGLALRSAGVFQPNDPQLQEASQTRHRLVWVDITLP